MEQNGTPLIKMQNVFINTLITGILNTERNMLLNSRRRMYAIAWDVHVKHFWSNRKKRIKCMLSRIVYLKINNANSMKIVVL